VNCELKKNGTITTRVVCAVCFLLFSFVWLFAFQADVLTVAQHVLSKGVTHYDRTVGAVLITVSLYLLQLLVYTFTRLSRRTHALTYLPSFLLLAMLSDFNTDSGRHIDIGTWAWLAPAMLVLWGVGVWLSRQLLPFETDSKVPTGFFSRRTWVNLLQMAVMMLAVAAIANTNAVYHFKAHAETALMRGDADEALRVGSKSIETDRQLTMLRIYTLSRKELLGERLFNYPIAGTSEDMLPMNGDLLILPADSIWKHLGGRPIYKLSVARYFEALQKDSLATPAVTDYLLCARLIDRDLNGFVKMLAADSIVGSLPRYYREALVLYQHINANPSTAFNDSALEEEWQAVQELKEQYAAPRERQLKLFEKYRDTYWYYYEYGDRP
jgi:hypothetical protein